MLRQLEISKKCAFCGKTYYKKSTQCKSFFLTKSRFCSRKCQHLSMVGKIITPKNLYFRGDPRTKKRGAENHNWKGGKPNCVDCGKQISHKCLRCKSCSRKGAFSMRWKGGRFKTPAGYIYVLAKDNPDATRKGYIAEHRLVASGKLGRRLEKFEQVHHLNGIKDDNRAENLEVINGETHCLITKLQTRVKELEKELEELKKEGYIEAIRNR